MLLSSIKSWQAEEVVSRGDLGGVFCSGEAIYTIKNKNLRDDTW